MKNIFILPCFFFLISGISSLQAQTRKFDSLLSMGKIGYRVSVSNKNLGRNEVIIKLYGFDKDARSLDFYIQGKVVSAAIDDMNNDGFFDLLLYVYSGTNGEFGTVYAFASEQNKSVIPYVLPDVMLDGKLNPGYKGHDQFSLMEGTLMQKFPVYKAGDEADKPSGGSRVIQYQTVPGESGGFKFKMLRSYEVK